MRIKPWSIIKFMVVLTFGAMSFLFFGCNIFLSSLNSCGNDENFELTTSLSKNFIQTSPMHMQQEYQLNNSHHPTVFLDRIVNTTMLNKNINANGQISPILPTQLRLFANPSTCFCSCNFVAYNNEFVHLKNVIIDRHLAKSMRKGGENVLTVMGQPETFEYYNLENGFFKILCPDQIYPKSYVFNKRIVSINHLATFLSKTSYLNALPSNITPIEDHIVNIPHFSNISSNYTVFVVIRYEYVNIYYSMTLFYNAFMNMVALELDPTKIHILLLDSHPSGNLDSVWATLFGGGMSRLSDYTESMFVRDMVWVQISYDSPINDYNIKHVPLLNEFRTFFLQKHFVNKTERQLKCEDLRVTFIWRHDYVAHARNADGHVVRKIKNEEELLVTVKQACPGCTKVEGVQMDNLPLSAQLQIIVDTDVVIAMHGAGLTHTLFLPQHAAIIELFPAYTSIANRHFYNIANWRSMIYFRWKNTNPTNEKPNHMTYVDPDIVKHLFRDALGRLNCRELFKLAY